MQNKSSLFILLFTCLFLVIHSCQKDEEEVINETLDMNQLYEYDLGSFGDEEGASIAKQALHYKVSEIGQYDTSIYTGKLKYTYIPALDYAGNDEVTIISSRGSDGSGSGPGSKNREYKTRIRFTINE